MTRRIRRIVTWAALAVPLVAVGCGGEGTVEITEQREVTDPDPAVAGVTDAQRFGRGDRPATPPPSMPSASGAAPYRYEVPEGWTDLEPSGMRRVSLQAGADTQCYLIELAGEGGGLVSNVNRWRGEVGHAPLDAAGVEAMERIEFLGTPCPLLDVSGDYQGMGGSTGANRTLLGTMLIRPTGSVFLKMVGPADEVAAHRDAFFAFVASLAEGG